jgi:hypothetical protein
VPHQQNSGSEQGQSLRLAAHQSNIVRFSLFCRDGVADNVPQSDTVHERVPLKRRALAVQLRPWPPYFNHLEASLRALGDCNGRVAFTYTSYNDYEIVADNLFKSDHRRVSDSQLPSSSSLNLAFDRIGNLALRSVMFDGALRSQYIADRQAHTLQQTRTHSIPIRFASFFNLLKMCPTPTAQWCAGP